MFDDKFPEGISVENQGRLQIIRYRWYSNFYIPLFIFFMIWDFCLVGYFIQAIGENVNIIGSILFSIPQMTIGLIASYCLIAILVNETIIELNNNEMKVVHRPLPWRGNMKINISDIQSVRCENDRGSHQSPSAKIVLYFHDGGKRTLLSMIQNRETAEFITKQISEFKTSFVDPVVR